MQTNEKELLLISIVPEPLKDDVVDTLMAVSFISGFSLFKIQGFSKEHKHFNVREQVEGYEDFFRFEVAHNSIDTPELLKILQTISIQKSIRYWVVPVQQSGLL